MILFKFAIYLDTTANKVNLDSRLIKLMQRIPNSKAMLRSERDFDVLECLFNLLRTDCSIRKKL